MKRKPYSAVTVRKLFWFLEFRKLIQLLADGMSLDEIKKLNQEQNLFTAASAARGRDMFNALASRIKDLDPSFYPLFLSSDLAGQKLLALVATMADDTLFFDFINDVIKEKLIIGSTSLTASEIRIFFKDKAQQEEQVAKWTSETTVKLGTVYARMLYEAGILEPKSSQEWQILTPIVSPEIQDWLKEQDLGICLDALTGVR